MCCIYVKCVCEGVRRREEMRKNGNKEKKIFGTEHSTYKRGLVPTKKYIVIAYSIFCVSFRRCRRRRFFCLLFMKKAWLGVFFSLPCFPIRSVQQSSIVLLYSAIYNFHCFCIGAITCLYCCHFSQYVNFTLPVKAATRNLWQCIQHNNSNINIGRLILTLANNINKNL